MSKASKVPVTALLCVALAALGLAHFNGSFKVLTVVVGLGVAALLYCSDLAPLKNVASLALLGFVCFSGFGAFWAMSSKFFLKEFDKIFLAAGVFLMVVLFHRGREDYEKRVCEVLAGVSAIYAALNVEAASTGLSERALHLLGYLPETGFGIENGTRLTGVFGSANTISSAMALGVLLSVALLCRAKTKTERRCYASLLAVNAFALLLAFSMGALGCFALSVVVYLAAAGEVRGEVLLHMFCGAVPTAICAFAAFPFFGRTGLARVLPLLLLCVDAVLVTLLEEKVVPKAERFRSNQKAVFCILATVVALFAVYAALGLRLSEPYTFGDALRRSAYPTPGQHALSVKADGDVRVEIVSQNRVQAMMHVENIMYMGAAGETTFWTPEDSEVSYLTFTADPGVTISSALCDGETIPLKYTLLPGFVANRLQGFRANQNVIQRGVFMADGMKLFRLHPVRGNGMGAFESGVTSVQDFYYVTRYVHNHYIQTMLESGVIGLALWLTTLLGLCVMLWRRRRDMHEPWLYGALAGALTMIAAHPFVEVSMSFVIFLCFAYAIFGLIVRICGPVEKKRRVASAVNVLAALAPMVFALTVCGNIAALRIVESPTNTAEGAFGKMEFAMKLDAYDYPDIMLTYIMTAQEVGSENWIQSANVYAQRLGKMQSNSIPEYLVMYYLSTAQYAEAIDAAKLGAVYSASDAQTWNACMGYLRQVFYDTGEHSPLYGENGEKLKAQLRDYYAMLLERNATAMESIVLDAANQDFFDSL